MEQLTCAIGFGEYLQRQVGVWTVGQLGESILQGSGEMDDIAAGADRSLVGRGVRVRVTRWQRLFGSGTADP